MPILPDCAFMRSCVSSFESRLYRRNMMIMRKKRRRRRKGRWKIVAEGGGEEEEVGEGKEENCNINLGVLF